MKTLNMDNLIYSDIEFISLKYEDVTKKSPSSQLTRTEGKKAGLRIPVLSAGVHTQETRTYSISSFGMLNQIFENLKQYPPFDLKKTKDKIKQTIGWVKGHMTVSKWVELNDESNKFFYFQLLCDRDRTDYSLITNEEYISSGYNSLFEVSPALQTNINIPVNVLIKVLYYGDRVKSFVSTPILIIRRDEN